ncbi:MAG: alpha-ribazole phosphatase [Desulfobulbus sp.]|nr:alpha-ribazole phosphatase [Desulfobulbus sp.]
MNTVSLYLIRHGETEQNKKGVLVGSTDTALNDHGRRQALSLRERINALQVDAVYSSPLARAVETASLVFGDNAPIITDSSLQEFHFGEWEGMHFSEIAKQYPEAWRMWLTDWEKTRIPGSENFFAFTHRVISAVEEIVRSQPGQRVAVVSHGGCIRSLLAHFFCESVGKGYWRFKVDNATLSEVEFMGELPILVRFNYR